jgi:predicted phage terminase large subunit-like protein
MAALQYVGESNYAAIIFRQTFTDLSEPGALIERSHQWLDDTDARWDSINHAWIFPSGAKLVFGYLDCAGAEKRYKGAEFQFIGFDQVEEIPLEQYRFMSSRARRLKSSHIPVRIWSTANPDGLPWVKQWFIIEGPANDRVFVPAKLSDNQFLDREDYIKSLANLDPVHREQLLNGNWDIKRTFMFKQEWFKIVKDYPRDTRRVRMWDFAATEEGKAKDPDYTSGGLGTVKNGQLYIIHMQHARLAPAQVQDNVKTTAEQDGKTVEVHIEEEKGSAGKNLIDQYRRNVLLGYVVTAESPTGEKAVRAAPLASAAEAGNVFLVEGSWNNAFLDEAEGFPMKGHKDQIDVAAYLFNILTTAPDAPMMGRLR